MILTVFGGAPRGICDAPRGICEFPRGRIGIVFLTLRKDYWGLGRSPNKAFVYFTLKIKTKRSLRAHYSLDLILQTLLKLI